MLKFIKQVENIGYIERHGLEHTPNGVSLDYLPKTIGEKSESKYFKNKVRTVEEILSNTPD